MDGQAAMLGTPGRSTLLIPAPLAEQCVTDPTNYSYLLAWEESLRSLFVVG